MKRGLWTTVAALICAMTCVFGLVACNNKETPNENEPGNGGTQTVAVESVTLNKTELTLEVGGEETLTATVAPGDATVKAVTWSSDDTTIATVDNGKVTAVAAGTATITAKAGDKTDTCSVTVNAAVTYTVTEEEWNTALDLESISNMTIQVTLTQIDTATPMKMILYNQYDNKNWSSSQKTLDSDGSVLYERLVYYHLTGGKNEYGAFNAEQYYQQDDNTWTKQTNSIAYFDDTGFIDILTLIEYNDFIFDEQENTYKNDSGSVAYEDSAYTYTDAEVIFIDGKLINIRLILNAENMAGEYFLEVSNCGTTTVTLPTVDEGV